MRATRPGLNKLESLSDSMPRARRPLWVTINAVLFFITAAVFLLFSTNILAYVGMSGSALAHQLGVDPQWLESHLGGSTVLIIGTSALATGVLNLALGVAFLRGWRWAWYAAFAIISFTLITALLALWSVGLRNVGLSLGILVVVMPLIALVRLNSKKVRSYFR